jgi:carbonic anhydrase
MVKRPPFDRQIHMKIWEPVMTATDDLIAAHHQYAQAMASLGAPGRPSRAIAIVTCMDARMDVYALLGLAPGEAHVIRNAGGAVTEDALRSLTVSQRRLGTTEIMLIHHTQCGMQSFTDEAFEAEIAAETGIKPSWAAEAFSDLDAEVRQSAARVRACPYLPHRRAVRGFVYDVTGGLLREVL